jgi:hypothetical protein
MQFVQGTYKTPAEYVYNTTRIARREQTATQANENTPRVNYRLILNVVLISSQA